MMVQLFIYQIQYLIWKMAPIIYINNPLKVFFYWRKTADILVQSDMFESINNIAFGYKGAGNKRY